MARIIKRKTRVKRGSKSVRTIKNKWVKKEAHNFGSGIVVIGFKNQNKRARYSERGIRIDQRKKKVEVIYRGPGGAYKETSPKYTSGWRKMAIAQRGSFYKG